MNAAVAPRLLPHQIRVIDEKTQLDVSISRLGAFIAGETFKTLDAAEKARLRRQCAVMTEYSTILGARIGAFGG